MNTMEAFSMGQLNRHKEMKVFDWIKAAKEIKARNAQEASAGLEGDFECMGGAILIDGKPFFDGYTFLASTWATPLLKIEGDFIPCFIMKSETEFNANTKWPKEALEILERI